LELLGTRRQAGQGVDLLFRGLKIRQGLGKITGHNSSSPE
jgi:hypothetical protein